MTKQGMVALDLAPCFLTKEFIYICMYMYGNKRKEKKNKKNVIKMYKLVTYLRALLSSNER